MVYNVDERIGGGYGEDNCEPSRGISESSGNYLGREEESITLVCFGGGGNGGDDVGGVW